jgi:hypothetical protein
MRRSIRTKEADRIGLAMALVTGCFPVRIERGRASTPHDREEILKVYKILSLGVASALETLQRGLDQGEIEPSLVPVVRKFLADWQARAARV